MFAKAELKMASVKSKHWISPPLICSLLSLVVSRVVRGWRLTETWMKLKLLALCLPTSGSKWSHCISKAGLCQRLCQSPLSLLIPFLSNVSSSDSHAHTQKQLDLSSCETKSGRDRTSGGEGRGDRSLFFFSLLFLSPTGLNVLQVVYSTKKAPMRQFDKVICKVLNIRNCWL